MEVEKIDSGIRVKRELEDGWFQHIEMPLPAVLTIQTGINKLRYATLMGIKKAKTKEIKRLTAAELGVAATAHCRHRESLRAAEDQADADFRGQRARSGGEAGREAEVRGAGHMSGVLVIIEQRGGAWNRMSWETLAAGQQLAAQIGQPVSAAVAGKRSARLPPNWPRRSSSKVYAVEHDLLAAYTADGYTAALEQLIRKINPSLVLFPHTYQVRDFAPKLATRFRPGADQRRHRIPRGIGRADFRAPAFPGQAERRCTPGGAAPHFASIQAGAFRADQLEAGSAPVEKFAPSLEPPIHPAKPWSPFRESARAVDLTAAEIIVSVGRGIKEKDNIPIVEELAKALGAELAASRPICDSGWLPMERQVGSSGQTVSPKVYIAVGISGAIQHLVGMKGAKTIVAINKDANAPIFEVADYGIVGDLFEVVPALVEEVKKAKA